MTNLTNTIYVVIIFPMMMCTKPFLEETKVKILIFEWGAYTQPDINTCLIENHVSLSFFNYHFGDKNHDDYFCRHFSTILKDGVFDFVFSVNFFPLIAKVCHDLNVKYISWSYDNPLNVPAIEDTLHYETNFCFLFDRIQAKGYWDKGFSTVYHKPLGVNQKRLSQLHLSASDHKLYDSEISFVGKLYPSTFNDILARIDEYDKGYLQAIVNIQSKLYGCYIIDELINDDICERINKKLRASNVSINKEQLSYSMATNITREERLILLNLLSKRHQLNLYSYENHPLLSSASYRGTTDYMTDMPKIFNASKINLNITLKILQSGIPLRVLDILGAGGFLVSNYQEEIFEHFENDKEVVMYSSIEDAIEKVDYYLRNEELRSQIAINGQAKAFMEFNYDKQLSEILKTAEVI